MYFIRGDDLRVTALEYTCVYSVFCNVIVVSPSSERDFPSRFLQRGFMVHTGTTRIRLCLGLHTTPRAQIPCQWGFHACPLSRSRVRSGQVSKLHVASKRRFSCTTTDAKGESWVAFWQHSYSVLSQSSSGPARVVIERSSVSIGLL